MFASLPARALTAIYEYAVPNPCSFYKDVDLVGHQLLINYLKTVTWEDIPRETELKIQYYCHMEVLFSEHTPIQLWSRAMNLLCVQRNFLNSYTQALKNRVQRETGFDIDSYEFKDACSKVWINFLTQLLLQVRPTSIVRTQLVFSKWKEDGSDDTYLDRIAMILTRHLMDDTSYLESLRLIYPYRKKIVHQTLDECFEKKNFSSYEHGSEVGRIERLSKFSKVKDRFAKVGLDDELSALFLTLYADE